MKQIRTINDLHGSIVKAKKKPVVIECCQMEEAFQVHTMEGVMNGKAGDWLIIGVEGEMYACDNDIFHKTYDLLKVKEGNNLSIK